MPCYFNSHVFNIYIPFVDEVDIIFHFLDIYYWYMGVYCFHVFTKNMGLCWIRGSSLPICPCETLESGEHVTIFPASREFGPFVTSQNIWSSSFIPSLKRNISLISLRKIMKNNNVSECLPRSYEPSALVVPPTEVQLPSGFRSPRDRSPLAVVVSAQRGVPSSRAVFLRIVFLSVFILAYFINFPFWGFNLYCIFSITI